MAKLLTWKFLKYVGYWWEIRQDTDTKDASFHPENDANFTSKTSYRRYIHFETAAKLSNFTLKSKSTALNILSVVWLVVNRNFPSF